MALEFAKDDLEYIKETLEWLDKNTVLVEYNRTNCETEYSRTVNSLSAIERGLVKYSGEKEALHIVDASKRYSVKDIVDAYNKGCNDGELQLKIEIESNAKLISTVYEMHSALESSLQMLEQTLAYRNANGLKMGNIFLEATIVQVKDALSKAIF